MQCNRYIRTQARGHVSKSRRPEKRRKVVMRAKDAPKGLYWRKASCPFSGQAVSLQAARQALRLQRETGSLHTATNEAGPRCAPQAARSLQTAKEPSHVQCCGLCFAF